MIETGMTKEGLSWSTPALEKEPIKSESKPIMSDFWKGVIIFFLALYAVCTLFDYLGRSIVYAENHKDQMMQTCQTNGYTWGECFNVIHGDQSAFNK